MRVLLSQSRRKAQGSQQAEGIGEDTGGRHRQLARPSNTRTRNFSVRVSEQKMNLLGAVLLVVVVVAHTRAERIRLEAKKLIKGKVLANGYSISAKSLSHCIEYCNRRKKTCDGVVFHEIIEKCRLISKCAAAYQVDNSSSVVYYSRRPQIMVPGYMYDPKSDSCIGLVNSEVNYATADGICKKQNSHLALISRKKVNQIATSLLVRSGIKWAWISDENVAHEAPVKPHGASGNDVLSQEVFAPEVVQWRNESFRSCWGVNDEGQWGQFSCKNDTMVALCQVHQFEV